MGVIILYCENRAEDLDNLPVLDVIHTLLVQWQQELHYHVHILLNLLGKSNYMISYRYGP